MVVACHGLELHAVTRETWWTNKVQSSCLENVKIKNTKTPSG